VASASASSMPRMMSARPRSAAPPAGASDGRRERSASGGGAPSCVAQKRACGWTAGSPPTAVRRRLRWACG
jgi:hypothetical protein